MRMVLVGDVMLGRLVNETLRGRPVAAPWGDTLATFHEADWSFWVYPYERNDESFLFSIKAGRGGLAHLRMTPTLIRDCTAVLAQGLDAPGS